MLKSQPLYPRVNWKANNSSPQFIKRNERNEQSFLANKEPQHELIIFIVINYIVCFVCYCLKLYNPNFIYKDIMIIMIVTIVVKYLKAVAIIKEICRGEISSSLSLFPPIVVFKHRTCSDSLLTPHHSELWDLSFYIFKVPPQSTSRQPAEQTQSNGRIEEFWPHSALPNKQLIHRNFFSLQELKTGIKQDNPHEYILLSWISFLSWIWLSGIYELCRIFDARCLNVFIPGINYLSNPSKLCNVTSSQVR